MAEEKKLINDLEYSRLLNKYVEAQKQKEALEKQQLLEKKKAIRAEIRRENAEAKNLEKLRKQEELELLVQDLSKEEAKKFKQT